MSGGRTVRVKVSDPDATRCKIKNDENVRVGVGEITPIKGKDGLDGKSAYQVAIDNGFVGSELEWLESLHGAKGDPFTYEDFTQEQLNSLKGEDGIGVPLITESDEGKVLTVEGGQWVAKKLPVFGGDYEVIPSTVGDVHLRTAQTYMDANVVVSKIPFSEVRNTANGVTATIG